MKQLWKVLNAKLPNWVGCLPKILGILVMVILVSDVIAILFGVTIPEFLKNWARTRPVALVNGAPISKVSFSRSLEFLVWRRGEVWSNLDSETRKARREQALEKLIDDHLIAQFASQRQAASFPITRASEDEFQQFLKQFPPPDEWKQRMELQGMNEQELRNRISDEVKQLDAVEQWLIKQPGHVTEAEAQTWFDTHKTELMIPERIRASHIFLTKHDKDKPDRSAEINELHRKLTSGEASFEELSTHSSDDDSAKQRNGDLGWFTRKRVPPEFADKIFALPVGEVSAPFESHLGWHILLVREKKPEREPVFDDVKAEILALLEDRWREAALKRLLKELRERAKIEVYRDRLETAQL